MDNKEKQRFNIPELESFVKEPVECIKRYMRLVVGDSLTGTETGDVIDDALASSGKMIRAQMLLLCGTFGPLWDEKKEQLCLLAAMVELIHLASLIHDDIVDEAPYRRGRSSIHSKYGRNAAVYAGDFLMARVYNYQMIEHLNKSGAALSKAIELMCIGEIGQDACRYNEEVSIAQYLRNVRGKTASLFRVACGIGARETGCGDEPVQNLEAFGENIGLMLQLRDDVLDFTGEEKAVGAGRTTGGGTVPNKQAHRDFLGGIYTMPLLKALEHPEGAKLLLPIMHENARRPLLSEEVADMEALVVRLGGIEGTFREIGCLAQKSDRLLDSLVGCSMAVVLMKKIVRFLEG